MSEFCPFREFCQRSFCRGSKTQSSSHRSEMDVATQMHRFYETIVSRIRHTWSVGIVLLVLLSLSDASSTHTVIYMEKAWTCDDVPVEGIVKQLAIIRGWIDRDCQIPRSEQLRPEEARSFTETFNHALRNRCGSPLRRQDYDPCGCEPRKDGLASRLSRFPFRG